MFKSSKPFYVTAFILVMTIHPSFAMLTQHIGIPRRNISIIITISIIKSSVNRMINELFKHSFLFSQK